MDHDAYIAGRRGFTLIELMIVVAVIGVLAAIAIPKFASLLRKAHEGAGKGNLGSIRSALNVYYGDMEGLFPGDLTALTVNARYLAILPPAKAPDYHPETSAVTQGTGPDDGGGWAYSAVGTAVDFGTVWVNCTHTDTRGTSWTAY